MNPNFPHAQMIVSRGADTIAQMVFPYADTKMYVRTGNPFNPSGGLWHDWKEVSLEGHTHDGQPDCRDRPGLDHKRLRGTVFAQAHPACKIGVREGSHEQAFLG